MRVDTVRQPRRHDGQLPVPPHLWAVPSVQATGDPTVLPRLYSAVRRHGAEHGAAGFGWRQRWREPDELDARTATWAKPA